MSKEAFDQGNEAFVDEKYEEAHEVISLRLFSTSTTRLSRLVLHQSVARRWQNGSKIYIESSCSTSALLIATEKIYRLVGSFSSTKTDGQRSDLVLDAVKDSEEAIQLDEKNTAAYLRKGLALYQQNLKEEALKVFARGLEFDGKRCRWILDLFSNLFFR